jgi:hypothetical protein
MRQHFPEFVAEINRRGVLWHGTLRPSEESRVYSVRINHERGRPPLVFIDDPEIDENAPHRYPDDDSLCLYWPREWRWSGSSRLADTIVPWAALWLYYYEIWQVCGRWLGPEAPHGGVKRPESGSRAW